MENYNLREDEVVLYKSDINLLDKKGKTTLLILTNINIVFITKTKKLLEEEIVNTEIFPVGDIKIYEGIPQVKSNANKVELYFKTTEKEFAFNSKSEVHKFQNTIIKLLTGKTTAERNAEKVKNAIGLVNDTLGVDIVKCTGEVAKNGIVGSITNSIDKFGKVLFKKKKNKK